MGEMGDMAGAARRAGVLARLMEGCGGEDWMALKGLFDGEMGRLTGEGKRYAALPGKASGRQLLEGLIREYEAMGQGEKAGILRKILEKR